MESNDSVIYCVHTFNCGTRMTLDARWMVLAFHWLLLSGKKSPTWMLYFYRK